VIGTALTADSSRASKNELPEKKQKCYPCPDPAPRAINHQPMGIHLEQAASHVMKWIISGVAVLLVACLLLAGCTAETRWEYKTVSIIGSSGHEATLNQHGDQGWELVGYSFAPRSIGAGNDYSYYVFKRVKRNRDWWKFWK